MEDSAVIYNKYWTSECISRLKKELAMADELYQNMVVLKQTADSSVINEINNVLQDIIQLKNNLSTTRMIMETYMCDMERAIGIIAEKIEQANSDKSKLFDW